jgi:hypothetical protein
MDLSKLAVPKRGRPIMKGGPQDVLLECIVFLKSRKIGVPQLIKVMDISLVGAYRWYRGCKISPEKLEELQEVVKAIKVWEKENGKEYNS